jgi:hypothetical protein
VIFSSHLILADVYPAIKMGTGESWEIFASLNLHLHLDQVIIWRYRINTTRLLFTTNTNY